MTRNRLLKHSHSLLCRYSTESNLVSILVPITFDQPEAKKRVYFFMLTYFSLKKIVIFKTLKHKKFRQKSLKGGKHWKTIGGSKEHVLHATMRIYAMLFISFDVTTFLWAWKAK